MKPLNHQVKFFSVFFCTVICVYSSIAQYSSQGPLSGSTFSDDNSVGNFPFNSPGNAVTSDNTRSTAAAELTMLNGDTHYLKVTGFGFSIPALASVTGIKVEVEKSAAGISLTAAVTDNSIRLVKGNTPVGADKAINTEWGGTDVYESYGDTTDMWGTTWSTTEINAPDFGVVFSAEIAGLITLLPTARIDHIRVTVFYIISLPIHFLGFAADTKKENEVLLKWITADNDEKVLFTVQRSVDGSVWNDLQNMAGTISFSTKMYQYIDNAINGADRYYYRIMMTLFSGVKLYTRILLTNIRKDEAFILFPNPAQNEVFISYSESDHIKLFSISGENIKVNPEKINSKLVKINTTFLKPGFYVIKAGEKQKQLLIQ